MQKTQFYSNSDPSSTLGSSTFAHRNLVLALCEGGLFYIINSDQTLLLGLRRRHSTSSPTFAQCLHYATANFTFRASAEALHFFAHHSLQFTICDGGLLIYPFPNVFTFRASAEALHLRPPSLSACTIRRQTLLLELRRRHSTFYLKYPCISQYVNFAKWLKTKLGMYIFYDVSMGLYTLGVLEIWINDLVLITMEN